MTSTLPRPTRSGPRAPSALARQRSTASRPDLRFEKTLLRGGYLRLAAMDEVGRGALAGPVTVGVVVVTAVHRPGAGRAARTRNCSPRPPGRRWSARSGAGYRVRGRPRQPGGDRHHRDHRRAAAGRPPGARPRCPDRSTPCCWTATTTTSSPRPVCRRDPTIRRCSTSRAAPRPRRPVHLRIKADLTCAAVAGASVLAKTERDRLWWSSRRCTRVTSSRRTRATAPPSTSRRCASTGRQPVHRRSWRLPVRGPGPVLRVGR